MSLKIHNNIKCAEIFCNVSEQLHKNVLEYFDANKVMDTTKLELPKSHKKKTQAIENAVVMASEEKYLVDELEMKCEPDLYDYDNDPLIADDSLDSDEIAKNSPVYEAKNVAIKVATKPFTKRGKSIENVDYSDSIKTAISVADEWYTDEDDDKDQNKADEDGEDDENDNDNDNESEDTADLSDIDYIESANSSESSKVSSKVLNFLNEPNKVMIGIAEGYKKRRILWDANHRFYKNRKRRMTAMAQLTKEINDYFKMKLTEKQLQYCIKHLRLKYRREVTQHEIAKIQGKPYELAWYCKHVTYLQEFIQYKPRCERGTRKLSKVKRPLPLPNLSDAQNVEMIKLYESFPCLWDASSVGYRFSDERTIATDAMLEQARSKLQLPELSSDNLNRYVQRIRYACTLEKQRKLQSEREEAEYVPECKFYEQIRFLESNVGPFLCNFCNSLINGVDRYRVHMSQHDGSPPYPCPICNYGFYKTSNYTVHLRRHTDNLHITCTECGKRFATSSELTVHRRKHTGERPYVCEICGQSFRLLTFFNRHERKHQLRPKYQCKYCDKKYYEESQFYAHTKAHLNVRDKVCSDCGKGFTCNKYLAQHKKIHSETKEYVCKICDKAFAQYSGLSGHMKSHGTTMNGNVGVQLCNE